MRLDSNGVSTIQAVGVGIHRHHPAGVEPAHGQRFETSLAITLANSIHRNAIVSGLHIERRERRDVVRASFPAAAGISLRFTQRVTYDLPIEPSMTTYPINHLAPVEQTAEMVAALKRLPPLAGPGAHGLQLGTWPARPESLCGKEETPPIKASRSEQTSQ
jgi:hypothetical protein